MPINPTPTIPIRTIAVFPLFSRAYGIAPFSWFARFSPLLPNSWRISWRFRASNLTHSRGGNARHLAYWGPTGVQLLGHRRKLA
jgi:hypothetical protein